MRMKIFLYPFAVLTLIHCWSCKRDKEPYVDPILGVSRSVIEVGNYADYIDTVKVSANVAWTINVNEEARSWLLVGPSGIIKGDSQINLFEI